MTALHLACQFENIYVAKLLLEKTHSAEEIEFEQPLLHIAAKIGSINILNLFSNKNLRSINFQGDTPLHIASLNNNNEFIKEFKKSKFYNDSKISKVKRNNSGYTALMCAVHNDNKECVKLLLDDIDDIFNQNLLHLCVKKNRNECFNFFIEKIKLDQKPIIKFLAEKDEIEKNTLLHLAALHGNYKLFKIILEQFDLHSIETRKFVFLENKNGQTCFHLACITGQIKIVKYLLEKEGFVFV
jgi:ankyrin repeat protein